MARFSVIGILMPGVEQIEFGVESPLESVLVESAEERRAVCSHEDCGYFSVLRIARDRQERRIFRRGALFQKLEQEFARGKRAQSGKL